MTLLRLKLQLPDEAFIDAGANDDDADDDDDDDGGGSVPMITIMKR